MKRSIYEAATLACKQWGTLASSLKLHTLYQITKQSKASKMNTFGDRLEREGEARGMDKHFVVHVSSC